MHRALQQRTFKTCLQSHFNIIDHTCVKGKFVHHEAAVLDNLRLASFEELEVPVEEEPEVIPKQMSLGLGEKG